MTQMTQEARLAAAPIEVDVWSDVQCGWCYIAKRRLEAAADRFDGNIEIEYHSFELAPEAPAPRTRQYSCRSSGRPTPEPRRS